MPIGLTIRPSDADQAAIRAAFERLATVGRRPRRVLMRIGLFVRREARRQLRLRNRDWGPGTNKLSQSLAMTVDDMSVVVGSNLRYAAIQQLGGVVEPRGHKYLALPVQAAMRRSGIWPRDLPRDSLRFVPNADIRIGSHSWTGPALVRANSEFAVKRTQKRDKQGRYAGVAETVDKVVETKKAGEVLFALVKRVTIKGRPYLVFDEQARRFSLGELERAYRQAIGGKG